MSASAKSRIVQNTGIITLAATDDTTEWFDCGPADYGVIYHANNCEIEGSPDQSAIFKLDEFTVTASTASRIQAPLPRYIRIKNTHTGLLAVFLTLRRNIA